MGAPGRSKRKPSRPARRGALRSLRKGLRSARASNWSTSSMETNATLALCGTASRPAPCGSWGFSSMPHRTNSGDWTFSHGRRHSEKCSGEGNFRRVVQLLRDAGNPECRHRAIFKGRGIVTNEKFAPYLDRAPSAASVKWRARRARMEHRFSLIPAAVREIKKEGESGGKKEAAVEELEGQQPSGESENSRETETPRNWVLPTLSLVAYHRGKVQQLTRIKTSKDGRSRHRRRRRQQGRPGANSTHSAEPKIPQGKSQPLWANQRPVMGRESSVGCRSVSDESARTSDCSGCFQRVVCEVSI
jgi:hypothetical protein